MLAFVTVGSTYVLGSVGVTIYRRRAPVSPGAPVSDAPTRNELEGCFEELDDLAESLEKHLENFHHLLAGYDPDEAQRWADDGSRWRQRWQTLGRRCRFPEVHGRQLRAELEEMAALHEELGESEARYTQELLRFGKDQVPRLDRVRARLHALRERIDQS